MAKWNVGEKSGLWKGGKSVASNGYMLIRVGLKHHLSDVRGYAYEHRIIAEEKLHRRLKRGEIVHHIDGNKLNNNPVNLDILSSRSHHRFEHRKVSSILRKPGEGNRKIPCACGCGKRFYKYDPFGRPRHFVSGHNNNHGKN